MVLTHIRPCHSFCHNVFFTNKSVYLFCKSHENNLNKIRKICKCSQKSMLWAILRRWLKFSHDYLHISFVEAVLGVPLDFEGPQLETKSIINFFMISRIAWLCQIFVYLIKIYWKWNAGNFSLQTFQSLRHYLELQQWIVFDIDTKKLLIRRNLRLALKLFDFKV